MMEHLELIYLVLISVIWPADHIIQPVSNLKMPDGLIVARATLQLQSTETISNSNEADANTLRTIIATSSVGTLIECILT
jgi:hypothetical protein